MTLGIRRPLSLAVLAAALAAEVAAAQSIPPDVGRVDASRAIAGDTVTIIPSQSYRAGGFHRFLLGSGYRDLWEQPLRVEVLDLASFAGGLAPSERGGGAQTMSLRLTGGDGATYLFRSVDKDAARALDPVLRESLAKDIMQDQIAQLLPSSALVVAPILEAAGVLHAVPRLYVMPDDPRLEEFRADFAGVLGLVEVRPDEDAGFAGSDRIVGSESFLERLEDDADNVIDAEDFLRARLLDVMLGDWDRHPDQWRWAAFDSAGLRVWRPIPRDRDWALSRLDGMMALAVAGIWPHYVGFGQNYRSAWRSTWSGRRLDRELLSGVSADTWARVAAELQRRVTDDVIGRAVGRMPEPHRVAIGDRIAAALKRRRDGLAAFALDFYALLAENPDVYGTDEEELARAEVLGDGSVRLTLAAAARDGAQDGRLFFDRTFRPDETADIRVYLRGDDDRFVATGDARTPIIVRVIGGGGDDRLEDRSSAGVARFYDHRGDNVGDGIDARPFDRPRDLSSNVHGAYARDWGSLVARAPVAGLDSDDGFVIGVRMSWLRYGFRKHPIERRVSVEAAVGTFTGLPRVILEFELREVAPELSLHLTAKLSGLERDHFYGFGNETEEIPTGDFPTFDADEAEEFFRAERWDGRVGASLRWDPSPALFLEAGPFLRVTRDRDEDGRFLALTQPLGFGDFEEAGVAGRFRWEGRDTPAYPTGGAALELEAALVPAALDVASTFGSLAGDVAAYVTARAPFEATLGARLRAHKVWGTPPYQEAAFLGGRGSLRGFRSDRFAGDAAAVGTVELRVPLAHFRALVPGELGLMGLSDIGRVWFDGGDSGRWHGAGGGGLFIALLERRATVSLYTARGGGRTAFYVGSAITY